MTTLGLGRDTEQSTDQFHFFTVSQTGHLIHDLWTIYSFAKIRIHSAFRNVVTWRNASHVCLFTRGRSINNKFRPPNDSKHPKKSHDKRARFFSPISASHSLKRQLNSPFRSSSLKKSPSSSTRKFRRIYSPATSDQWQDIEVEILDADIDEDYKLFQTFKSELSKANIWENFSLFLNLVSANSFPLDNLSFLLFLDTVAFYSCNTTTQMVYLPQTKRFWKTGYRLFHAKFLY